MNPTVESLFIAVKSNRLDLLQGAIASGVDVNSKLDGRTALHWAASLNNLTMAQALIDGGADINSREDISNYTPLHISAMIGNQEVTQLLLNSGASTNERDAQGRRAAEVESATVGSRMAIPVRQRPRN